MPKVSVVIPTYNSIKYLIVAIESVLNQTFQDFEVLVIDDGSTDNTKETLKKYKNQVTYIYQENAGVAAARNNGINRAQGKYIAFLDADDFWLPEKLERQVNLMENNPNIGLSFVGTEKVDANLNHISYLSAESYEDYSEALLLKMNIVSGSCSSAVIRKDIAKTTEGFDKNLSTCADWEYWLRLSLLTDFFAVKEYLVKYRVLSGSMSSNPFVSKADTLKTLNKFFSLPNLPEKYKNLKKKAVSNNLMVVSGEFLHNRMFYQSFKCLIKSLTLYPVNIKRPLGLPFRIIKRLLA